MTPRVELGAPVRMDDLTSSDVGDWFERDPRLLLPVGSCTQHGPFLPLGTDNRITEKLAEKVCARTGILLAPLIPYGVASREDRLQPGTAGLERKTLHRLLNELVESWEQQGLEEITLLTGNANVRHIQALAMVLARAVRVRSIDTRAIDVSRVFEPDPDGRSDAFEICLMLHLAPEQVKRFSPREDFPASVDEQKGRRVYEYLVDRIVERLGA